MDDNKTGPPSKQSPIQGDDQPTDESPLLPASPEARRAFTRKVTVEPVVFLVSIALGIFLTVTPQYIKQRLADARNFNLSSDEYSENGSCTSLNTSDPDYIIEQEIQADTSFWQMLITICGYLPSLFTAPLLGAWSDTAGRKFGLGVAVAGYVISAIAYLLVYYFVLPIWVIAIGYFLQGITGSYGLLLAVCYAYVADVTAKEKRMLRIAVVQAIFVFSFGISQTLTGFVIEAAGFGSSFWLATVSLFGALIYIGVPPLLMETIQSGVSHGAMWRDKIKIDSVYQLFHTNTNSRRIQLILLLLIAFLTETFNQASLNVTIIYGLGPPFCWSSVVVGLYSGVVLFVSAGAMIGGTKGLAVCLTDVWILQVAMVFGVLNGLFNAFARTTLELFLAALLTCLRSAEQPLFHLMLSKLVEADEQGVMFACESSILNLASFCSPLILNNIYSATVATQPNFVFLLMAVLRIVPITIIGIFQVVVRYNRNSSPAEPETAKDKVEKESKGL